MAETLTRFAAYLESGHHIRSVDEIDRQHVEGFVLAPLPGSSGRQRPAIATMHVRRSALRLYFRIAQQAGLDVTDPTLDLRLPPRSGVQTRPLTTDEIALCRSFSLRTLTSTRHPTALALAEATARTSEIPQISVSDVDPRADGSGSTAIRRPRPAGVIRLSGDFGRSRVELRR